MKNIVLLFTLFVIVGCEPTRKQRASDYFESRIPDTTPKIEYVAPLPETKYGIIKIDVLTPDSLRKRLVTDVIEIDTIIDNDYKYRELDLAERNLRDAEFYNMDIHIIDREMLIFDSYSDASIARQNSLTK